MKSSTVGDEYNIIAVERASWRYKSIYELRGTFYKKSLKEFPSIPVGGD